MCCIDQKRNYETNGLCHLSICTTFVCTSLSSVFTFMCHRILQYFGVLKATWALNLCQRLLYFVFFRRDSWLPIANKEESLSPLSRPPPPMHTTILWSCQGPRCGHVESLDSGEKILLAPTFPAEFFLFRLFKMGPVGSHTIPGQLLSAVGWDHRKSLQRRLCHRL